jgi:hypothetical protein
MTSVMQLTHEAMNVALRANVTSRTLRMSPHTFIRAADETFPRNRPRPVVRFDGAKFLGVSVIVEADLPDDVVVSSPRRAKHLAIDWSADTGYESLPPINVDIVVIWTDDAREIFEPLIGVNYRFVTPTETGIEKQ